MGSAELPRVRCPDCGKEVGPLVGELVCQGCGRRFVAEADVWDLLPASRDAVKVNEDRAHVEAGLPTWRRLFIHKRYWLEWCDTDWLPTVVESLRPVPGRHGRSAAHLFWVLLMHDLYHAGQIRTRRTVYRAMRG